MISLDHVSKFYGRQDLLKDVSLSIHPGERIALVGVNGAGKTTLLKTLLGSIDPDKGQVHRKKALRIGDLPQEVVAFKGKTVLQQVLEVDSNVQSVIAEFKKITHLLEKTNDPVRSQQLAAHQSHLLMEMERLGAYNLESRAKQVLAGLGFKENEVQCPVETLSGGWMMRVALARILFSQPDLMLLDEPTNHLDLDSLLWLENFLQNTSSALLLISHDRTFLDRVVQKTFELEKGILSTFPGNYSQYLGEKQKRIQLQEAAFANQQEKINQMEDFIARNRSRKDRARQVQSRIKTLEQMERIESPSAEKRIAFQFPEPERAGKIVLELTGVSKSFGSNSLYQNLDLMINREDRIAILGPNGAGKSTLLKIMAGIVPLDSGQCRLGHNVRISYFAQHQLEQLDGSHTVWQEAAAVAGDRTYGTLRGLLAAFLFGEGDIEKKVSVLSGGEKSRLVLLKMLLSGANFLLFDEPTNHLDIPSREVLEEALQSFTGTLCLITHDRHLINALVNKVLYIRDGKSELFPGNYQDFEEIWKSRLSPTAGSLAGVPKESVEIGSTKSSARKNQEEKRLEAERRNALFRLQAPLKKRLKELEETLARSFEEKEKIEGRLADPKSFQDGADIEKCIQGYQHIQIKVDELMQEWELVMEKLEETGKELNENETK